MDQCDAPEECQSWPLPLESSSFCAKLRATDNSSIFKQAPDKCCQRCSQLSSNFFFSPFPVSHGWFMHRCCCWGKWLKEGEHLCDPLQFNNSADGVCVWCRFIFQRNSRETRKINASKVGGVCTRCVSSICLSQVSVDAAQKTVVKSSRLWHWVA